MDEQHLQVYQQLIQQLLSCPNGEVYQLLERNADKLDDNFAAMLRCWAKNTLAEVQPEEAESLAAIIGTLSNLIQQFPSGDKSNNIEIAITGYEIALTIFTRADFPQDWVTTRNLASTYNNLGTAYSDRIKGDPSENFKNALDAFSAALQIYTCAHLHENYAEALTNLGILYQNSKQFTLAKSTFASAIETVENLRSDITSGEESKRKFAEKWNLLFRRMVEVCLVLGKETKAIEYIERSKTRNLVELISANRKFTPIQYPEIQNLLDNETAIIQFYIFNDCFGAFIITRNNDKPLIWQSNSEDLKKLKAWILNYVQLYDQHKDQWKDELNNQLIQLGQILHIEQIVSLVPSHCQKLTLIPHRYLHLFPIHSLIIKESYLLDLFPKGVGYVPSCQLLQQLHNRQRDDFQSLFAIQTPTPDSYEKDLGAVTTIKKQFKSACIFKEDKAKKSTIFSINENGKQVRTNPNLLKANSVLFFCHGKFEFNSPLESGLQLADESLNLADIINHLRLENCRLVTLSACETGLIDTINSSDEYIGLPSGFFLAGSNNVVSSLWFVRSTPTALLMIKFYQELEEQDNIVLALNTAQRWLRDTTVKEFRDWLSNFSLSLGQKIKLDKEFAKIATDKGEEVKPFASPYYWSAFCATGKGV
ncbi:CHAT domain-containing protein [Anabaena sp. UHCC 0253]|uniref:CHAT domain-containing protein n=1 Tax=Anabaena sp. UHCC 0253 TaxID=2590019 RepID=UPI001444C3F1|nr:CHAT domain-containing protein [Anabaena sp. UHCC 0253]MTJ53285.1 CHAT domain-containing protein [Anabaena sp. UHCC 0253]